MDERRKAGAQESSRQGMGRQALWAAREGNGRGGGFHLVQPKQWLHSAYLKSRFIFFSSRNSIFLTQHFQFLLVFQSISAKRTGPVCHIVQIGQKHTWGNGIDNFYFKSKFKSNCYSYQLSSSYAGFIR